jgi:6-phospho-3-hexuloisomerase
MLQSVYMNSTQNVKKILAEINSVLKKVNNKEADQFINLLLKTSTIIVCGAGRSGFIASTFAMRLTQLDLNAHTQKEIDTSIIGKDTLVVICSGTGETKSVYEFTNLAKNMHANLFLITSADGEKSSIASLTNNMLILQSPSKTKENNQLISFQPLGSLYEQSLFIFFEGLIPSLMEKMQQTEKDMKKRYINLN